MTKKIFIFALLLVIAGIGAYSIARTKQRANVPISPSSDEATATSTASSTPQTASAQNAGDSIEITAPKPNASVSSPLKISGQALGAWYFEAQFPVELVDDDGNIIAQSPANATGDWQKSGFVPFSLALSFTKPTTTPDGLLIFKKDNPSGDPSRDVIFAIPVNFK